MKIGSKSFDLGHQHRLKVEWRILEDGEQPEIPPSAAIVLELTRAGRSVVRTMELGHTAYAKGDALEHIVVGMAQEIATSELHGSVRDIDIEKVIADA